MRPDPLSALLSRCALASATQVREARRAGPEHGCTCVEELLGEGIVDEETLCRCFTRELHVSRCDAGRLAEVAPDVLAILPADVATEHRMVPLGVEPDGAVVVAMEDPTDAAALAEAAFFTGRDLLREVAPASEIARALHDHYGAASPLWPPTPHVAPAHAA